METLKRYPVRANELLQAWDSADELILQHMGSLSLENKRILIVNDQFGALSCGLKKFNVTSYTDSFVSYKAIKMNGHGEVTPISDLKDLSGIYDYVLVQLPKNMSFFEDILCHLTHHLQASSQIVCGSMVKHLAPASFDLLNKYIGKTTTSLAQKKARLIFANFEKEKVTSPYPLKVKFDVLEDEVTNHSNLFSREKLDIGTRFLLENMPKGSFQEILDLGCANGIVGIIAKKLNPQAKIIFSDESQMAIMSAKANYQKYFSDEADFLWTNCYEDGEKNSLDLVICNPPFHQGNTIGDFIAWQMFNDAKSALKEGGIIRVIGNSHLAYQTKLKKIFGQSRITATNTKFMIVDAEKRKI
jgi:16S rRNA G1207 methylase RsmC